MKKRKTEAEKYYENMPPLQPIQIAQDGAIQDVEYQPERPVTLANRLGNFGNTVADALLGKRAMPTDNIVLDGETMNATVSNNPRVGGILPDLTSGFRDNYNNRFNPQNFANEQLEDGRNKGFAYRLGEGLGTLGRFIDSPLGRGVLAYGLNNALGYGRSMQEGLTAAVGRQNAQTADRIYRQQLEAQGIDTSNIGGNIDDSIYRQILYGQQLKENAEYRKLYLENQQRQNEIMNQIRQDQLDFQKQKSAEEREDRAASRALTARGQDLSYAGSMAKINADKEKANSKKSAKMQDAQSTLNQISLIRDMVRKNPKATGLDKGLLTGDLLNRVDNSKGNIETRTAIDSLRTKIRHDLTGAQFSPKEAREYEKFLPNVRDSKEIIEAKLDALEKRYYADFGVSLTGNTSPKTIGKYTVRVKQ